jgi:predicted porin
MKKTVIAATAVLFTGLTAAPAAVALESSASLYGDFRLSLGHFETDGVGSGSDVDNNHSHGGLRVLVQEDGLAAFIQYERLLDNDDGSAGGESARQFFGGVSGRYGTLSYGRQATQYKLSGQKLDPFYNTSVSGVSGAVDSINGAGYGLSALTDDSVGNGFINNQIAYLSPELQGFRVNAALFVDDGNGAGEKHDYAAGVEYALQGLTLGVQMLDLNSGVNNGSEPNFFNIGLPAVNGQVEALRYYGAYAAAGWGLGASYETLDLHGGLADQTYLLLSGWYGLSDRLRLAAALGHSEDTPFAGVSYTLGASYTVLENFNVYLAARQVDHKSSNPIFDRDTQSYALGVSYSFDIALLR